MSQRYDDVQSPELAFNADDDQTTIILDQPPRQMGFDINYEAGSVIQTSNLSAQQPRKRQFLNSMEQLNLTLVTFQQQIQLWQNLQSQVDSQGNPAGWKPARVYRTMPYDRSEHFVDMLKQRVEQLQIQQLLEQQDSLEQFKKVDEKYKNLNRKQPPKQLDQIVQDVDRGKPTQTRVIARQNDNMSLTLTKMIRGQ